MNKKHNYYYTSSSQSIHENHLQARWFEFLEHVQQFHDTLILERDNNIITNNSNRNSIVRIRKVRFNENDKSLINICGFKHNNPSITIQNHDN